MRGYLKQRLTNLIGNIDPNGIPGQVGDKKYPLLFFKEAVGGDELFDLEVVEGENRFALRHMSSNRYVCLNGSGDWETREGVGNDEKLVASVQPDMPQIIFIYRRDENNHLLDVIEFVPQ